MMEFHLYMQSSSLFLLFLISRAAFSVSEYVNCGIVTLNLHGNSSIRCFITITEKAKLFVAFEIPPLLYEIKENYKNLNDGKISSELFVFFIPTVDQNNTIVTLLVETTNLTQESVLSLNLLGKPKFECTTPEDNQGVIAFNCTGINTRNNTYLINYVYSGTEMPMSRMRVWRKSELEEFTYFMIEKSWLLSDLIIRLKFYSQFFTTVKNLPVFVPNISLPMKLTFTFVDAMTNENFNFTCRNLENGIVPVCKSDYFEATYYVIEIYDPNDRKYTGFHIIKLNNPKTIKFGMWKCIVINKNGRVQLDYDFKINDKPCVVTANLTQSYTIFSLNNGLVYRVRNFHGFMAECLALSFPNVTDYTFYEIGKDVLFKVQSKYFDVLNMEKTLSTYWGCSAANENGETHSAPIIIFYEPYSVRRADPSLFMLCILPVITLITLCCIFITALIHKENNAVRTVK